MSQLNRVRSHVSAILLAACLATASATPAFATEWHRFDVPATEARAAIREFAAQAKVQIMVDGDNVARAKLNPVSGGFSTEEGLRILLAQSGLQVLYIGDRSIALVREDERAKSAQDLEKSIRVAQRNDESLSDSGSAEEASTGDTDSSRNEQSTTLEEIVVTAQKREQSLQTVPMSITAITGNDIRERGASTLLDLQYSVPGLSLLEYGPGQERIQMRGISSAFGLPTVGRYLDEMPISVDAQGLGVEMRFIDMERIEVLRGPQGTLYGEGSMGGTIRYLTANPDLSEFGGNFEAQAGSVADGGTAWRANGAVSVPIVEDRVGLRLTAGYEDTGGWIDSVATSHKDVNAAKFSQLRGKLLAKVTDSLEASVMVMHQEQDQGAQNFADNRRSIALLGEYNNQNVDLMNGVIRWNLGFAELVNSVGYVNAQTDLLNDLSKSYVPILQTFFGFPAGFIASVGYDRHTEFELWTDEIRLMSQPGGSIDWTIGLYGRQLRSDSRISTVTEPNDPGFLLIGFDGKAKSETWSVFGEVAWHPVERLTVAGGLRYFEEKRSSGGLTTSFGVATLANNAATFDSFNPRISVSYEFSPVSMVYLNAAKGFRSGGFNSASVGSSTPLSYDPETLWTYEIGTKQQLFHRSLFFEGAVYYNDWADVQGAVFPLGSSIGYTVNGGNVDGFGVDLSLTANLTESLTVSATYGWNNMDYNEDTAEKNKGDPVDFAVQETWSASLAYRRPFSDRVAGFFRLDYQHSSKSSYVNRNSGTIFMPGPRDMINARLGLDLGHLKVSIFADNLTDDDTQIIPGAAAIFSQGVESTPRVFGVNIRSTF